MAYNDEKEQKSDEKADEKVFTLYENRRYSIFQSIVNQHFKEKSISNELRDQYMENICKLFDEFEEKRELDEEFSETDHCVNIVRKDVNSVDEFGRIAALYHDSCACLHINDHEARKKAKLTQDDEGKDDDDDDDDDDEKKQIPSNVIKQFKPILLKSYMEKDVQITTTNFIGIAASTGKETRKQNETEFQDDKLADWSVNVGIHYVGSKIHGVFGGKKEFKYHAPDQNNIMSDNVFELPDSLDDNLRVGLIGDWGSGTEVARDLLEILLSKKPDIIIHLGDVYYSGTDKEFKNNYCKILNDYRKKYHKCVVLSIPGNHDWYDGGTSFYKAVRSLNKAECVPDWFIEKGYDQQSKSFFVIKNKYWQLQGMDTGRGDDNPLKVKTNYPALQDGEVKYHNDHIDDAKEKRHILLFSHHPLFSAFKRLGKRKKKDIYYNNRLSDQFKDQLKYITAWYWGHEHHFAIYLKNTNKNGKEQILEKGRLLGHSAVPLKRTKEIKKITSKPPKRDLYPVLCFKDTNTPVCTQPSKSGRVFNHGYAILELKRDSAWTTYYEIDAGGYTNEDLPKPRIQEDLLQKNLITI